MTTLLYITLALYSLSFFLVSFYHISSNKTFESFSRYAITAGLLLHSVALLLRAYSTGHAPMADMYETILFYSWSVVLVTVVVIYRYGERSVELVSSPAALLALVFSFFVATPGKPLVLVLRTRWFETHVISSFAAYALFTLAFAGAVVFLIKNFRGGADQKRDKDYLDIMGRSILWGFFFFSLSMFLAAMWSYLAWGSYWLWDPKVIWSFIVWFYYAGAVHGWYVKGFRGGVFAVVSIVGFVIVLFTYLGVGMLMKSTHSF